MKAPLSLAKQLTHNVSLGFAAFWVLALIATALVLKLEQDELADRTLQEAAKVFLVPVAQEFELLQNGGANPPFRFTRTPSLDPDGGVANGEDALIYRLLDQTGAVLIEITPPANTVYPETITRGYTRTASHVFFTTAPTKDGIVLQLGHPAEERFEAYLESFVALLIPMVAILPLVWLLIGWIATRSLAQLDRLSTEIAQRNEGQLDPIDASDQPQELQAISASLNGFMIRLAHALESERAFATSAAHELRTPLAIALAQVQRLRAEAGESDTARLVAIEGSLKRMTRLVVRLLQLARAEAGVGLSDRSQDIRKLLDVILDDYRRDPTRGNRLQVNLPDGPVLARIDPDAFAMLVGNLIDNAFQHSPEGTTVMIALSPQGEVSVVNDGPVIDQGNLVNLTRRFQRGTGAREGFGLGLYIANTFARHAGGTLELYSPPSGQVSRFQAIFKAPVKNTKANLV